jgi:sec-independent protein translocase protein TatB
MGEITVILLLALIFLGPKKLPELASGLGKLIREIRKTTSDVKNEIQLDEAIRKPFEELREAVTLHPEELKRRDRLRRELEAAQKAVAEATAKVEQASQNGAAPALPDSETTTPAADAIPAAEGPPAAVDPAVAPAAPTAAPAGTIARDSSPRIGLSTGAAHVPPPPPSLTSPVPPPTVPNAAKPGVQEDLGSTLRRLSETHHRNTGRNMGAVSTPLAEGAADRSNTTQALSEADLAAIAVAPTAAPPPPPRATRTARAVPPPMPGLTEAKPAAPPEEKKPDPAT